MRDLPRKERSDIVAHCDICGRGKRSDDGRPCAWCVGSGAAPRAWTTGDEIAFLRGRGSRGSVIAGAFVTSREFLKGYLAGARLRTDWNGLDRGAILRAAEQLLAAKEGIVA